MTRAPRDRGKTVRPLFLSPIPDWYGFLFEEKVPVLGEDVQVDDLVGGRFGPIDLVVILDTNSYSQLPRFEDFLKRAKPPILVVDHHVTSDQAGPGRNHRHDRGGGGTGAVRIPPPGGLADPSENRRGAVRGDCDGHRVVPPSQHGQTRIP